MHPPAEVYVDATRLRPSFTRELPVPADEAILRLREALRAPDLRGSSMAAGRCAELLVDRSERRVWSPHLNIRIDDSPAGSIMRCRFSPRPDIWTGIMFIYFLVVFLILFGATLGYVQQLSNEPAWGFWAIPAGLLVLVCIHVAGYVGQRLAADQMRELQRRLDSLMDRQFGPDPEDMRASR